MLGVLRAIVTDDEKERISPEGYSVTAAEKRCLRCLCGGPRDALDKIDAGERYRGSWWQKIVKPGLETLDNVQKPKRGASEWSAVGDTDE